MEPPAILEYLRKLTTATARAARRLSERAIQGLFDQADSDKDGYISFIDVQRSQRETLRARKQAAQQVSSCARTRRARKSGGVQGCCRCPGSFLLLCVECPCACPQHKHRGRCLRAKTGTQDVDYRTYTSYNPPADQVPPCLLENTCRTPSPHRFCVRVAA